MAEAILVTGGAGYVGSHTCKALRAAGLTPVTYDNLSRGHRHAVQFGPLVVGDLADTDRLTHTLRQHAITGVLHFAAFAHVGESVAEPLLYFENNAGGTLSLLKAMAGAGIHKLVVSSTCATYGMPQQVPMTEDHPQQPINPYGASKLMMERMVLDSAVWGLRSVMLRYFNAAGSDPDGSLGEEHDPEPHLIPNLLRAALGQQSHITIHGDDYPTPDGTCVRDYIHVSDLAAAHVLALRYLTNGGATTALNLGTGTGFSVREVVDAASRLTQRDIPATIGPRRPGDPPVLVADPSRARAVLGWTPVRSALDDQIGDAWRWMQAQTQAAAKTVTS